MASQPPSSTPPPPAVATATSLPLPLPSSIAIDHTNVTNNNVITFHADPSVAPLSTASSPSPLPLPLAKDAPVIRTPVETTGRHPEESSWILGRIWFTWVTPLIRKGAAKPLQHSDLFQLPWYESSTKLNQLYWQAAAERYREQQQRQQQQQSSSSGPNDKSNGTATTSNESMNGSSKANGTNDVGVPTSKGNAYGIDDELLAADASRAEASMTTNSFIMAMVRLVRVPFYASGIMQLIYAVAQSTQPLLLERLVKSMTETDSNNGVYWSLIMFGMALIGALCNQMHLYLALKAGQRLRAVSISLVYRKSLQLNSSGTKGLTTGEIVNLISNDSQRFYDVASTFHLLWACPLQIILSIYFLIDLLGAPAVTGVGILLLMGPLNSSIARWNQRVRSKHMPITDERLKMCSEVLQGIRVVKLLGWELPFMTKILNKRAQEMWFVKRELQIWGCIAFLLLMMPVLATTLTFVTFSSTGHFLTPDKAFTALAFFSNLRFPLMNLGTSINTAIQLRTSIGRLSAFMVRQNVRSMYIRSQTPSATSPSSSNGSDNNDTLLSITNGSFSWVGATKAKGGDKKKPNDKTATPASSSSPPITVAVAPMTPTTATNGATKSGGEFQLRDVNITAMRGELLTIVGTVGSGKSTLVDGILGEATIINGSMHVNGNIAYVAQQAWILNATVRENILFGKEWDEDYYNRVLDACALWPDLDGMADGDRTMVGEKGLTMSGGQKQRLSLARCAYARADISILDDPLSALDSHTGKYIFDALLGPRGLMRNHGVTLLVTHATHFLSQSSYVIVLHSGHMVFNGPYNELVSYVETSTNTTNVTKMTNATISSSPTIPTHTTSSKGNGHTSSVGEVDTKMNLAPTPSSRTAIKLSRDELRTVLSSLITEQEEGSGGEHDHKASSSSSSLSSNGDDTTTDAANQATKKKPIAMYAAGLARATANGKDGKLMTTEERERGSVGLEVWAQYIKCIGGAPIAVCVVLLLSVERFCFIASDWWISCWSGAYSGPPSGDWNLNMRSALTIEDQHYYMYGYLIWTGATAFLAIIRVSLFAQLGGRAASTLFTRLLTSIFRSPMVFFETTPVGRIVARLAYDTDVVDGTLISRVMGCFSSVYWVVSATVVISNVSLWMLCVILPLLVIYYFIQKYYRRSCVELQRLDALSRSPIQGHFQESLQGTATIRAYGQQARFIKESDLRVDTNQTALFSFTVAARWLAVRLETMGAIVLLGTGILCWAARNNGISGSMAGLAIMWSYNFTLGLNSVCLTFTEVEAKMVSVERIEQYSYLPPEPPLSYSEPTKLQTVPSDWPSSGAIEFNNVTMSYRDGLEPALRNMSVIIHGGEKIGVVGRTGAGKSTIATALFRLRDPSEGTIKVDGIDLHYLGLDDVRSRSLCIIPQDPVLFSGPLRYNFDPFGQYTDDDIWIALEQVRMASSIRRMKDGLLTKVEEKGSNFSVGERQLFCLVRALLRKSKILLLDEATASVDPETDAFIQRTVRSSFTKTTLLTIAHRLHTVMDYDRIMVMDNGRVAEIGRPIDLLANNQSMLSKLVDSTGHAAAQQLRTLAINAAAANAANTANGNGKAGVVTTNSHITSPSS